MPDVKGLVAENSVNKSNGKHIHNYSTFDRSLSYRLYATHRYGDYSPSFEMEGVPSDELRLNSLDRIDSLSLASPFKGSIRKIKDSFMVPNMAILPRNWDLIYAQNSKGDDIVQEANSILIGFPASFRTLWHGCLSGVLSTLSTTSTAANVASFLTAMLRTLVLGEYVYSNGSLLNLSGYKHSGLWSYVYQDPSNQNVSDTVYLTYDQWFDQVIMLLFGDLDAITVVEPVGSTSYTRNFRGLSSSSPSSVGRVSFRSMIELFRENPLCYISSVSFGSTNLAAYISVVLAQIVTGSAGSNFVYLSLANVRYVTVPTNTEDVDDPTSLSSTTLNLSRLLAYQLVCAHFFSNSNIDFIYTAELYRQYIANLCSSIISTANFGQFSRTFTWNGYNLQYDDLAGYTLRYALGLRGTAITSYLPSALSSNTSGYLRVLALYSAIFGFRKSLRYGDYFTGSRPLPLAPINTDVSVNNNLVDVVDITRNIQAQRFANSVMRSRSKIEEYVKSLFGRAPQPDYHNPFFLTSQTEIIYGDEVQNTANDQVTKANSRTANFAGRVSPYTFTFHNDDMHPCIYLQIISYDTKIAYSRSVDRQFLHIDRFDMFNPDFQYIGDQPVYGVELGYQSYDPLQPPHVASIFSYQTRDMEYKQRFDVVSGGFSSGSLPGWSFTDNLLGDFNFSSISPDFIRSRNTDLDRYFLSLTGFSLGTYFHFICVTDNNVSAKRAMAVDPQILA